MHDVEYARVKPRCFTVAKRVIQVESTLHTFEQRDAFEVTNRHAVFVNRRSVINAQRQSLLARQAHEKKFYPAAQLRVIDVFRISMRETIELAIANGRGFTSNVECFLALSL